MKYIATHNLLLLDALTQLSPQSSKNTLRSWIKDGRVEVDNAVVKNASVQVLQGQEVKVGQRKKMVRPGLPIVYADSDLVVVNKPSGLLSVSAAFEKEETLHALLKAHYHPRKVFVVHRLDQDTSGVMVFALNQTTCDQLKNLFAAHQIIRAYIGIVEGELPVDAGTWESFQREDAQYKVHETYDPARGRLAITHYQTIASSKRYSCLELRLETGRKNQIRVHCQSAGCPIVGDKKYGSTSNPLKRLCLHAHLLGFQHPTTKKQLRFESPIPEEFFRLVPSLSSLDPLSLGKSRK